MAHFGDAGDAPGDLDRVRGLVAAALHDPSGESVAGTFVGQWVSNAGQAVEQLEAIFERDGLQPAYAASLRAAVLDESAPPEAAVRLLAGLRRWSAALVDELGQSPAARERAIAVGVAARLSPRDWWVRAIADPSLLVRLSAVQALDAQGRAILDAGRFLLLALSDEDAGVRRAAAMSLGQIADVRALGLLTREYADPDMAFAQRELESAISAVIARPPPALTPAERELLAARIARQIDALRPTALGDWTVRVCKQELRALPVLGNQVYLWALRPDGTVLCMDHERFGHPSQPETDALARFAVYVAAARRSPELAFAIPACPSGTRPCRACLADGAQRQADGGYVACQSCAGLGWHAQ